MSNRPKHVVALSDKLSGLKFMQRAKAAQAKTIDPASSMADKAAATTEASSSEATAASSASLTREQSLPAAAEEKDDNEEHWTIPRERLRPPKRSISSIVHEPGWNAWLNETDEAAADSLPVTDTNTTKRRLFGSWGKKPKQRKEDAGAKSAQVEPPDGVNSDSGESKTAEAESRQKKFIRPGSLSTLGNDQTSKKTSKQKGPLRNEGKSTTKDSSKGKKKRKDHGLLSGFSRSTDSSKGSKKARLQ